MLTEACCSQVDLIILMNILLLVPVQRLGEFLCIDFRLVAADCSAALLLFWVWRLCGGGEIRPISRNIEVWLSNQRTHRSER